MVAVGVVEEFADVGEAAVVPFAGADGDAGDGEDELEEEFEEGGEFAGPEENEDHGADEDEVGDEAGADDFLGEVGVVVEDAVFLGVRGGAEDAAVEGEVAEVAGDEGEGKEDDAEDGADVEAEVDDADDAEGEVEAGFEVFQVAAEPEGVGPGGVGPAFGGHAVEGVQEFAEAEEQEGDPDGHRFDEAEDEKRRNYF